MELPLDSHMPLGRSVVDENALEVVQSSQGDGDTRAARQRCKDAVRRGANEQLSRSEIQKKSWEKNRARRVGAQRAKRAARAFERLQELRAELLELESVSLLPKPEPVGLKGHEPEDAVYSQGRRKHAGEEDANTLESAFDSKRTACTYRKLSKRRLTGGLRLRGCASRELFTEDPWLRPDRVW
ncbi:hypothetical protein ON010_g11194 [Phytophthora cinnamomi]|nr:hypothetical protein ON010_g11194 [Phytophthora cinnamomi]